MAGSQTTLRLSRIAISLKWQRVSERTDSPIGDTVGERLLMQSRKFHAWFGLFISWTLKDLSFLVDEIFRLEIDPGTVDVDPAVGALKGGPVSGDAAVTLLPFLPAGPGRRRSGRARGRGRARRRRCVGCRAVRARAARRRPPPLGHVPGDSRGGAGPRRAGHRRVSRASARGGRRRQRRTGLRLSRAGRSGPRTGRRRLENRSAARRPGRRDGAPRLVWRRPRRA